MQFITIGLHFNMHIVVLNQFQKLSSLLQAIYANLMSPITSLKLCKL